VSEPFLGEIRCFGFGFAPVGWAQCNGQLLSISQNTALFALIGTYYGGNGQTNFALPDLRGRGGIHVGQGPGLSPYVQGQLGGVEAESLLVNQLPSHSHTVNANNSPSTATRPAGAVLARGGAYAAASDGTTMAPDSIAPTGGGQPINVLQPYLVLNYCIALTGIFPSQN
jgi:microcystin-dependent protein